MWVVRELFRLVERVAVAVVIAVVVGELWSLGQSGSVSHRLQISFLVVGAVLLLLGSVGRGTNDGRAADLRTRWAVRGVSGLLPAATPSEPQLAPGVVLLLSGAIVIVLGFLV